MWPDSGLHFHGTSFILKILSLMLFILRFPFPHHRLMIELLVNLESRKMLKALFWFYFIEKNYQEFILKRKIITLTLYQPITLTNLITSFL